MQASGDVMPDGIRVSSASFSHAISIGSKQQLQAA